MLTPDTTRSAARLRVASLFAGAGLASPDLDARLLVCAACGIDHLGFVRDPDLPLGAAVELLAAMVARRLAHEPVSRILGQREFWGLPLQISPAVLDPRPETEGLVGAVIDAIGGEKERPLTILDLGTGSGAILCALLSELPGAFALGVDRSFEACRVARTNFANLGFAARSAVVQGSWTDAIGARFDVIVSNPPYIRHADLVGLEREVRDYDPAMALDGGEDGLDPYRAIVPCLRDLLAPSGIVAFECGFDQGEPLAALMRQAALQGRSCLAHHALLANVAVYRDLSGHDRVVIGVRGVA